MKSIASIIITIVLCVVTSPADAATLRLGDMCRLKGQEINTLQGLGLVVGLRGTGDNDAAPTARALSRMMQLMGGSMAVDSLGQLDLKDVAEAKNVAMVFVTARIPAVGSHTGDQIDVTVNAINAKSLEGGYLMLTPMLGPRADNPTVYAVAQGRVKVSIDGPATTGTVQGGAKMEATVPASFQKDGMITLILERDFASFDNTQRIEDEVNSLSALTLGDSSRSGSGSGSRNNRPRAQAIDQLHVQVQIPELYQENPIKFISLLLNLPIQIASHSSRVVINEREGIVVIGKDVEVAPVLVTHRNLRIEAGGVGGLVGVDDKMDERDTAKLKNLADALNALDVPTSDLIAIIKTLKAKGDLYGEVVFQ
ncbi:flagellar basal body P-ring protein FlgI [Novipirellula caenicola]|uniref:Flagellar P-ring protein n=1 Tax=Novipirellula caenicola TaxID=1536901 RepID=A0ABP9VWW6_9BACT